MFISDELVTPRKRLLSPILVIFVEVIRHGD